MATKRPKTGRRLGRCSPSRSVREGCAGVYVASASLDPPHVGRSLLAVKELLAFLFKGKGFTVSTVYNVREFGAKGDGVTLDTEAIQKTIDACAGAGGGVVTLPPGTYLCSTLYLRSNMTFELGQGAVLLGSKNLSEYGAFSDDKEFYGNEVARANSHAARLLAAGCVGFFIRGIGLQDVTICGPGVIDGNEEAREDGSRGARTIFFEGCRNVTLRDITVVRSPSENTGFLECEDIRILGIKIRDSFADGIYIISCRRVLIDGCVIENSGDDPLSLKNEGRPERPSFYKDVVEDVLITNTTIRNAKHPAFKIGTDTAGVFRNIQVSNCIFENVGPMFQIQLMRPKLKKTKERIIENVMFSNVIVRDARNAIDITTMGVDEAAVSDLLFDNLLVSGMREPSRIHGSRQVSISNVAIKNSRFIHSRSGMMKWLSCLDTKNLMVRDVTLDLREPLERVVEVDRTDGFTWDGVSIRSEAVRDCVVRIGNASDVEIRGCILKDVNKFLQVGEGGLSDIRFLGNDFQDVSEASFAGWDAISGDVRPVADRISSSVLEMEREIDPGTALTIKVRLRNEGSAGAFLLKVTEDGKILGGRWVFLGPGECRTVAFETEPIYRSGRHAMRVGSVLETVTVRETPCTLTYPGPLELRLEEGRPEASWVKVPVRNVGGKRGVAEVMLEASGHRLKEEISLEPGEFSFVTFEDFKGVASLLPLKVGDYPPLEYYTYANTEGRFLYHHDGRIEIHAGGERGTFEQHAVVYLPRIVGDYTAVCRLIHQDDHTGEYAGAGLVARNVMTDDGSAGFAKYFRVIKYGGFMLFLGDIDGDGKFDPGHGGGWVGGRIPFWFKLEKRGKDFRAYVSGDGEHWVENQAVEGANRILRGHHVLENTADTQDVGVFGLAYGNGISKVILEDFSVTPV